MSEKRVDARPLTSVELLDALQFGHFETVTPGEI